MVPVGEVGFVTLWPCVQRLPRPAPSFRAAKNHPQHDPEEQQLLPDDELLVDIEIPPEMILWTGWPVCGCTVNGSSLID